MDMDLVIVPQAFVLCQQIFALSIQHSNTHCSYATTAGSLGLFQVL